MITGDELAAARSRAKLTQDELAQQMDVSLRTVGNWERVGVPRNKEARLRDLLPLDPDGRGEGVLDGVSNYALVAEILRRLDQGGNERSEGNATTQTNRASGSGATDLNEHRRQRIVDAGLPDDEAASNEKHDETHD